ncbi:MAG: 5-(carboxyamino)imidazole ribonucleotide mutase [Nitrospinota bacterium]|jgi:phosphoribosylaminoimidazole carboxylase PurE protein|nr:5-(carboxyamino)imidazole ribonucleotide mutase [Nitrospinota bacterium]MDP7350231.1 5-(carboxyamino)imidazole ribonucleotide mutase [Nitrospinota bacterium]MDP7580908.1 5-(carboxyamino)imidazole ribonucleotide mutase [Nitrospinota bacterium]HJN02575.1 5-(carboxyamino)imidazole ribonucleotide mutase [Nitrospinota bacterium]
MKVAIVMGSDSDLPVMQKAAERLKKFEIEFTMTVTSAHRSPDRTRSLIKGFENKGIKVIIAGAGGAAHLAGVIAAETILPVIGVPINSSPLQGFDALLATVQMPGGIPVATMAVGEAGAKNAAILAAQILALSDKEINNRLNELKKEMALEVEKKADKIK